MLQVATVAVVTRHDAIGELVTDFAHEIQVRIALQIPIGGLARVGVRERDIRCALHGLHDNVAINVSLGAHILKIDAIDLIKQTARL